MQRLAPGESVDRFRIERHLAEGGSANVYLARDSQSGQLVVLKLPLGWLDGNLAAYVRFQRQCAIQQALQHPAIPAFIAADLEHRPAYLALEYVPGTSLRQRLAEGPLSVAEIERISLALAEAVAYCHQQGVVHADIKPENVILGEHLRLIDFGNATRVGQPPATGQRKDAVLGTPSYMAPEQVLARPATAASDVYAVGTVCYEMAAGKAPLQGDDPLQVLRRHLTDPIPSLAGLRPELPRPLAAVVMRALRRRPAERFADGAALLAALRQPEREDQGVLEQPDPPLQRPLAQALTENAFWILAAAVLLTVGGTLLAVLLLRRPAG